MDSKFDEITDNMFNELFQRHPLFATFVGGKFHKFDGMMESGTIEDVEKDISMMKGLKENLSNLDPNQLSESNRLDRELLLDYVALQLFSLEDRKDWEEVVTAGGGPVANIGSGLFPLFTRPFAPFEERIRSIIERLRGCNAYLENSKELWRKPVKLWTKIAIQECQTTPGFFMVIQQAIQAEAPHLADEFQAVAEEVTKKIQEYRQFLENDVLPRATHEWAYGRDEFEKLLQLRRLPYTANEILAMGEQFRTELRKELEDLAKEIDPECKSWEEVRERIKSNHPADFEKVLAEIRKASDAARDYVIKKKLATVAEGTAMEVLETPEYMRPLIPFAALMPAELLSESQISVYIVTPGSDRSFLTEHNYPSIYNMSVHEGFPGHHLQISHGSLFGGMIRLVAAGFETVEGWAHYCEQMMLEEGFYDEKEYLNPKEILFIQKLDALWRAVRIILDVKLHTHQISYEDAIEFLIAETGMAREGATAEVTRYTMAPGYQLSYLIGKHLLLELRDQLRKKLGDKFSLLWFHDVILRTGGIPFHNLKKIYMEKAKELLA
ncbi:MAG: DUF885 domain-containing protein [Candidatus Heimdallarchaeota archaeon]